MRFVALFALAGALIAARGVAAQAPNGLADPSEGERYDPDVVPTQFSEPAPRGSLPGAPGSGPGVADPATPVVRIQVRTPAHIAPGKPLSYRILVSNTSNATAYRVVVRHPVPEAFKAAAPTKVEPNPDAPSAKELVWTFEELKGGATKEITLTYDTKGVAKSIKASAFVKFEHGQAVTTDVESPKLAVRKSAPERANGNEPIAVRVEVTNSGRVPVKDVQLVEDISPGFAFVPDADGEATNVPTQRLWRLKDLGPGQTRAVTYQVRAKGGADFATVSNPKGAGAAEFVPTSNVKAADAPATEPVQSTTKVVTPRMDLAVDGPVSVGPGELAAYTIKVTNSGNAPLSGIRVTASVPENCAVKNVTAGSKRSRDQIAWDVPTDRKTGPLAPGQVFELRFKLLASRGGTHNVVVGADAGRGLEQSRTVKTTFAGTADLKHTTELEPGVIVVGKQGLVTYRVQNTGSEAAKNVVLRVELPAQVRVTKVSPTYEAAGREVTFKPVTVLAGDAATFTITYEAAQPGRAFFGFRLFSDGADRPLVTEKPVTIQPAAP